MHLVGFIIRKFVMMHSHMNVKFERKMFVIFVNLTHRRCSIDILTWIFCCSCLESKICCLWGSPHTRDGSSSFEITGKAMYTVARWNELRGERMPICSRNMVVGWFLADVKVVIKKWTKFGPQHWRLGEHYFWVCRLLINLILLFPGLLSV